MFVTDEADCSFNRELQNTVFGEEGVGNQAFWSLPDVQQSPTSAVCWNAGVSCDFGLDSDQCSSINLDVDGNETSDDELAALYPAVEVHDLRGGHRGGQEGPQPGAGSHRLPPSRVFPRTTPTSSLLSYAEGADATNPDSFQAKFGIGQGCSSAVAEAVPPVRLKEFAEAFLVGDDDNNLFSVCSTSYEGRSRDNRGVDSRPAQAGLHARMCCRHRRRRRRPSAAVHAHPDLERRVRHDRREHPRVW